MRVEPKERSGPKARIKLLAINLFLAFHIVAITCWSVPLDLPLFSLCRKLVRPYFLWAGLFQTWDMFSPMPWPSNSYVEAVIIYKDGSRKTWSFPRMEQLSLTQRSFKERYRKFSEVLQIEDNDALWPDVARRIARLNSTPSNPAKTVVLVRKWSLIIPRPILPEVSPDVSGRDVSNHDVPTQPEPWDQHVLLGYGVRPEDLP
jgi:hypothetical protein